MLTLTYLRPIAFYTNYYGLLDLRMPKVLALLKLLVQAITGAH
jgi:hypothetical protein